MKKFELDAKDLRVVEAIQQTLDEAGVTTVAVLRGKVRGRLISCLRDLEEDGTINTTGDEIQVVGVLPFTEFEWKALLASAKHNGQIIVSEVGISRQRLEELVLLKVLYREHRHFYLEFCYRERMSRKRSRRGSYKCVNRFPVISKELHEEYSRWLNSQEKGLRREESDSIPSHLFAQMVELGMIRLTKKNRYLHKLYYVVEEPVSGLILVSREELSHYLRARKGANRSSNEVPFSKLHLTREQMEALVRKGLARKRSNAYFIKRKVRCCLEREDAPGEHSKPLG